MRITNASITVVGTQWRELVFLELQTDTGLTGVSEYRMVSRTVTFRGVLERTDAASRVRHRSVRRRAARRTSSARNDQPGEVSQSALACFDVACWDLISQSLKVPVWRLSAESSMSGCGLCERLVRAERDPAASPSWRQASSPVAIGR
jgi:galactonate dehydratase